MLEKTMRVTFRHFSTFFLIVASLSITVQLVYAIAFHDVLSVTEIHDQIEDLPETRLVRNVGASDLAAARTAALGTIVLELLMLPFVLKATARVVEVDSEGGLPTVSDAYRAMLRRGWPRVSIGGRMGIPPVAVAIGFAAAVIYLAQTAGYALAELSPNGATFVVIGLVRGSAHAIGAPFALVPGACLVGRAKAREGDRPKLY